MKKRIISLVSLLLVGTFLFLFASCSPTEDETTETTEVIIINKTKREDLNNTQKVLEYFNALTKQLKQVNPKMEMSQNQSIGDLECDSKEIKALETTLKKYMLHKKEDKTEKYGDSLKDKFPIKGQDWASVLTLDAVRLATVLEYDKTYEIIIRFYEDDDMQSGSGNVNKAFDMPNLTEIKEQIDKAKQYLAVGDLGLTYTDCNIKAVVDKETDQILSVDYNQNVNVVTTVAGVDSLKDLGENIPLSFQYRQSDSYKFDWTDPSVTTTAAQ